MAVTVKVTDEANAMLEFYLGYKRMKGERMDKEDAVAQFVIAGIRKALPSDLLDQFDKTKRALAKTPA